jgi:hypothetical protein
MTDRNHADLRQAIVDTCHERLALSAREFFRWHGRNHTC